MNVIMSQYNWAAMARSPNWITSSVNQRNAKDNVQDLTADLTNQNHITTISFLLKESLHMVHLIRFALGTAAILIATASCLAQTSNNAAPKPETKPNSHVKVKYDQGKNQTMVTLKTIALTSSMNREFTRNSEFGNLDLDLSFTYPGRELSKPAEAIDFRFKGTAKNQLWQQGQKLLAIIDDKSALFLGDTSYKSISQTFYFEEVLAVSIPYEAMQRIASAKTLAFQLGTRNIPVKDSQLDDLKAMAAKMRP
jgi:hypothetical protein